MNKKGITVMGFIFLFIDQIIKKYMINKNIIILPNILSFSYTENTGIAFNMFKHSTIIITMLSSLIITIIIVQIILKYNKLDNLIYLSLIFMLFGAISNLIDRFFKGFVVDYIGIEILNFPYFNIADILIVIGISIYGILIIKKEGGMQWY